MILENNIKHKKAKQKWYAKMPKMTNLLQTKLIATNII